jgi:hypothetical protein
MKSGDFDARSASPTAAHQAGADRRFVVATSVTLGLAFVSACALAFAQFSILVTATGH